MHSIVRNFQEAIHGEISKTSNELNPVFMKDIFYQFQNKVTRNITFTYIAVTP